MSNPIVTFEMENGKTIKAELYPEIAPNTVNNFLSLVNKGYYDGLTFHRVIYGFMILRLWQRLQPKPSVLTIPNPKSADIIRKGNLK